MESDLEGTWSLILGSSAGMGRACALALARAGSNILGVHFDTATRQAAVDELIGELEALGVKVRFFNENAASDAVRERIVAEAVKLTGTEGVRVVLHSLAFGSLVRYLPSPDGPEPVISRAQLTMTMDVMAHSLVYWVQDLFAADLLPAGSNVFAMTSAGPARYAAHYGAISASKSLLEAHVRQLALEAAPYGVAVNAVRAGMTLTESFLRVPESPVLSERGRLLNPHGRLTTPEDVAEALLVLARSRSSWLTGNVIGVDGGEILTV